MARYSVTVNATSHATLNTEQTFVELALSGVSFKIKEVTVRVGDTTTLAVAGVDNDYKVRLVRKSAAGVGGVAGTEVQRDGSNDEADVVSTIKTGTTNFSTVTILDVIDDIIKNGRETYNYIAIDENDTIVTHPTTASGNIFGVLITSGIASQKFQVTVVWEE